MNHVIDQLHKLGCSTLGHVVHVGAGEGREIASYVRGGAGRIRLVEALPQLADVIRAATRRRSEVEVVQAAASDVPGEQPMFVVNNAGDSSLLTPDALLVQFPNLKVRDQIAVQGTPLRQLLDGVRRDSAASNLLVIEVNGMEARLLRDTPPEALEVFDFVLVRSALAPLYRGAEPAERTAQWFEAAGFDPVGDFDDGISANRIFAFRLDRQRLVVRGLQRQLAAIEERSLREAAERRVEIAQLQQRLGEAAQRADLAAAQLDEVHRAKTQADAALALLQTEARALAHAGELQAATAAGLRIEVEALTRNRDEIRRQLEQRDEQLRKATAAHDAQARSAAEHEAQIGRLVHAREQLSATIEQHAKQAADLQSQVARSTAERDAAVSAGKAHQAELARLVQTVGDQGQHLEALEARIGQALAERDSATRLAAARQEQVTQAARQKAEFERAQAASAAELAQARQTAYLSTKLLRLREGDLKDLQARYKEALAAQERQRQLLAQLQQTLQPAAAWFEQLRQDGERRMQSGADSATPALKAEDAP
jgi:FkbM family methyltransferase